MNNLEHIKLVLKKVMHLKRFCGICLEGNDLTSVNDEFSINGQYIPLEYIVTYIFQDASNILLTEYVCQKCLDEIIRAYKFLYDVKERAHLLTTYVCDLYSKAGNIVNCLDSSCNTENSNAVIVLKNSEVNIKEHNNIDKSAGQSKIKSKQKFINRCAYCNVTLHTFRDWKQHEKDVHTSLQCNICGKYFTTVQYLTAHYKIHSKIKCEICQLIICSEDLKCHLKDIHKDEIHLCIKCQDPFYSAFALDIHMKISHLVQDTKLQCLSCLKNLKEEEVKDHKCKFQCPECIHHRYLMSYRDQILNHATHVKCIDCNYVCRKKESLLGHVNRDHLNHRPYACDKCGQQFYSKMVLFVHITNFHRQIFICAYCDVQFKKKSELECHVKFCEVIEGRFKCERCYSSFESKLELSKHEKIRHSEKTFSCTLCNKEFVRESKLKEHKMKVHSVQNKGSSFSRDCVVCDAKFKTRVDIFRHMKMHGRTIQYRCKICNFRYDSLRKLRAHNRKHSGPFSNCTVCDKEMKT